MSEENTERIYTVNLTKAWDTPKYRRTDRVINIIKEFTRRHMQTNKVKIDQDLNRHIWSRGKKNPPRKIRLRMIKEDDDTVVVSSFIEEKGSELSKESVEVEEPEVQTEKVEKEVEEPEVQTEKVEKEVEEPEVQTEKVEKEVKKKDKSK
jgi:large subunit ribosomal protein L31e